MTAEPDDKATPLTPPQEVEVLFSAAQILKRRGHSELAATCAVIARDILKSEEERKDQ